MATIWWCRWVVHGLGTAGHAYQTPSALQSPALRCPCPLQVVDVKVVVDKPARGPLKPQKVAECTVGDETGIILLTARNEQGGWVAQRRRVAARGGGPLRRPLTSCLPMLPDALLFFASPACS
jgi:hypothetical protein